MNYEGRANAVVIVEWVLFILTIFILVWLIPPNLVVAGFNSSNEGRRDVAVNGALIYSAVILFGLIFTVLLTIGIKKRYSTALKICYIFSMIITVLYIWDSIRLILTLAHSILLLPFATLIIGLVLWYKLWSINVIMEFTKGLTSSPGTETNKQTSNHPITEKV